MGTKTKFFTSELVGAPVLSGTAGALISILDAVLVTGFGLQTASSVTITGGVATVNVPTAPSATVGTVILVAGATPAGLNGEQRVTATTANSVSFATAITGVVTGTVTIKVAPAGWSKLYAGTNLAAYKITAAEGTGCILRVDDTGATTAQVRGYEAMTDVATGTGPFPTVAQLAGAGAFWSKSNTASAAARAWRIFADDRGFYFHPQPVLTNEYQGNYFGDIVSLKSSDPYACVLRANSASRIAFSSMIDDLMTASTDLSTISDTCLYVARAANGLGGSILNYQSGVLTGMSVAASTYVAGAAGRPYPSPVDNSLLLTPVIVYDSNGFRGYFPGLSYSPQFVSGAFGTGDVVSGSGAAAGTKVMVTKLGAAFAASPSQCATIFTAHAADWR